MGAAQQDRAQEAVAAGVTARATPDGDHPADERPYWLAPHVYPCFTEDHGIALDLRRDRYLGFNRFEASVLAQWVQGWPGEDAIAAESDPGTGEGLYSAEEILAGLVAEEVLVTRPETGKATRPAVVAEPQSSLLPQGVPRRPQLTAGLIAAFVRAMLAARLRLACQSMEDVVRLAASRRAKATTGGPDITGARELVYVFAYLRPLLFASPHACLLNALALLEFLAPHGWSPSWVWGVQTTPFSAHCWLQEGCVVVNDLPERVRAYTPILVV